MNFYSTRDSSLSVPFHTAIFNGPAPDGGLFMPERIPHLSSEFIHTIESKSVSYTHLDVYKRQGLSNGKYNK